MMATPEERAEDYRLEAAAERRERTLAGQIEAGGCPECGHLRYVVTDGQPATRTDPAWWEGHCTCANSVTGGCDCDNCADGDVCVACCQCDED